MGALEQVFAMIEIADPQKILPPCEIRVIEIGPQALYTIPAIVRQFIPDKSTMALIFDKSLIYRQGLEAKKVVQELLKDQFIIHDVELDDGYSELHASQDVIAQCAKRCKKVDGIISLGGGTITDIGKMTSVAMGGIPHVVIQTAASVDGYTDNVSVILINGVKRTVPSRWPDAVIADTTLISEAPELLNKAGYGEINSMFTAPADWRLAAVLTFEKKFHWAPVQLLHGVGEGIEQWSPGLENSEIKSIEKLVNALAIRGIVTGVADTTACLSGIEHLISHMLDMSQSAQNKQVGQHGAQVGVGSVIAAAVWEYIFNEISFTVETKAQQLNPEKLKLRVTNAFQHLDSSGAVGEECWNDFNKKVKHWNENCDLITKEIREWDTLKSDLRKLIKTPEEIVYGLASAGSPTIFKELKPAFENQTARWAVANCHLMRNRFVGIDFLEFLGFWNEHTIDWVFARASQAVRKIGVRS